MEELLRAIFENGKTNVGIAVACLACFVAYRLYIVSQKRDEEHRSEIAEMHAEHAAALRSEWDKREAQTAIRLEDSRAMTLALEHAAQANVLLEKSASEGTSTLRDLVSVVGTVTNRIDEISRRMDGFDRQIEAIKDAVLRPRGGAR